LLFTLGIEDAEYLEKEFQPITKTDMVSLDKFNFYLKLMIGGRTSEPFSGVSEPPMAGEGDSTGLIRKISSLAYGVPKEIIETEIEQRMR
jgi:hypothetical protein